jgi:predicted nucleic acid-binding protein
VVVDASVVTKWFIAERDSDKAVQIRDLHTAEKVTLTSPLLLLFEVGNTLTRHPSFAHEDALKAFQSLLDVGLKLKSFAEPALLERAFTIARERGMTFYDAAYIAITDTGPLITADLELAAKAKPICQSQLLSQANPEELALNHYSECAPNGEPSRRHECADSRGENQ